MPLYEYQCDNCGKQFEKLVGFSDPNRHSPECPECASENTHKRLSTIAAFSHNRTGSTASSNCGSSGGFR